jgi:uncharacterized membrane protein (UPF0127 family)
MRATATAAFLSAATLSLGLASCDGNPGAAPASIEVKAGGKAFRCRLALDEGSREKGLSGVASLAADEGMLFVFPDTAERSFWMVDCLMDLDIAFMDAQGFVTAVHTMPKEPLQAQGEETSAYHARLARYPSGGRAQYALEVAPGTLSQLGVRRGSRVEFARDSLKPFVR